MKCRQSLSHCKTSCGNKRGLCETYRIALYLSVKQKKGGEKT